MIAGAVVILVLFDTHVPSTHGIQSICHTINEWFQEAIGVQSDIFCFIINDCV